MLVGLLAGADFCALLGRMPSAVGYQLTLGSELGQFQERIAPTGSAAISSIQATYVPADDYVDPAPATTFSHLDPTTNLDRSIAGMGIYPAINPLASASRLLDSCRSPSSCPGSPPACPGGSSRSRRPCARSRRSWRASTMVYPDRCSTWSGS